jgi:hypothetical protein
MKNAEQGMGRIRDFGTSIGDRFSTLRAALILPKPRGFPHPPGQNAADQKTVDKIEPIISVRETSIQKNEFALFNAQPSGINQN